MNKEEAIEMLVDGDVIHSMQKSSFTVLMCDWDRADVIEAIKKFKVTHAGPTAENLDHALAVFNNGNNNHPICFETKAKELRDEQ